MAGPITWQNINSRTSAQDLLALQRANQGIQDAFTGVQGAFNNYQGTLDQGNMLQLTNALQNAQTPEEIAAIQQDPRAQQLMQALSFENQAKMQAAPQERLKGLFQEQQDTFNRDQFQQQVAAQPFMGELQQAILSGDPEQIRSLGSRAPNIWAGNQVTTAFNESVARQQKERELSSVIRARDTDAAVTQDAGAMARERFEEERPLRTLSNQDKVNELTDKFENRQLAEQTKTFAANINNAVEQEFQYSADLAIDYAQKFFNKNYSEMSESEKDATFALVQRDNPGTLDIRKTSRSEILTDRIYEYSSENRMPDTQANELLDAISSGAKGKTERQASTQAGEAYMMEQAVQRNYIQLQRKYGMSPVEVNYKLPSKDTIDSWIKRIEKIYPDNSAWHEGNRRSELAEAIRKGFAVKVPDPNNPDRLINKRVFLDESNITTMVEQARAKGSFKGFLENFLGIPTLIAAATSGETPKDVFDRMGEDNKLAAEILEGIRLESEIWQFNSNPTAKKLGLQIGKSKGN